MKRRTPEDPSLDPPVSSEGGADALPLEGSHPEGVPEVDIAKLQELIDAGLVPDSVLALYRQMLGGDATGSFLEVYRKADPDKQRKILEEVQRMSRDVKELIPKTEDKRTLYAILNLLGYVILALILRTTTPKYEPLEPKKTKEGAALRILEQGGEEVFAHPEQFGIEDVKAFCLELIEAGYARSVLDHLELLTPAAHSEIILASLKASHKRRGKGEAVYVLETLSRARDLDLAVAQELCRLNLDSAVAANLGRFKESGASHESNLQEVVILLLKREKIAAIDLVKCVLGLEHILFGNHLIVAMCFFRPKLLASLEESGEDVTIAEIYQRIPSLKDQLTLLQKVGSGGDITKLQFIPTRKLADRIGTDLSRNRGSYHPPYNLTLSALLFLSDDVAATFGSYHFDEIRLPELKEVSDPVADLLTKKPLTSLDLRRVKRMSPVAAQYFSERKGWFLSPDGFLARTTDENFKIADQKGPVHLGALTDLSAASASLLTRVHREGPVHLDGLKEVSADVATLLLEGKFPVSLSGLEIPPLGQPWGEAICRLILKNYDAHSDELRVEALRSLRICYEAKDEASQILDLKHVRHLSPAVAAEVGLFEGTVLLDGLENIPDECAPLLVRNRQKNLSLNGLSTISNGVADYLGDLHGNLSLNGLLFMSAYKAAALGRVQGHLCLLGITQLDLGSAIAFKSHTHDLFLDGLVKIEDDALRVLAGYMGRLSLQRLKYSPDSDKAAVLYEERGWSYDVRDDFAAKMRAELVDISTLTYVSYGLLKLAVKYRQGSLALDSAQKMTSRHYKILGAYLKGPIFLRKIKEIQPDEARDLCHAPGPLVLGVETMNESTAVAFEGYAGVLSLPNLRTPTLGVLTSLAKCKGPLILNGITYLTPNGVEALARHQGYLILKSMSRDDLSKTMRTTLAEANQEFRAVILKETEHRTEFEAYY